MIKLQITNYKLQIPNQILIILICLVLTFSFTTKSYAADTETGRVLTVKKKVYLIRGEQRTDAEPQMMLLLKDAVETDKQSRTKLFFNDDSILNLGELSRVEVEEYLYSPEKKRSKSVYRLIDGSLRVVVGRSDLEIHTPTAVVAARGTKFFIWMEGSGDFMSTRVLVLEGEVIIRNIIEGIKGIARVGRGQMSRIPLQEPPEEVSPIDAEVVDQFTENTVVIGDVEEPIQLSEPEPSPSPSPAPSPSSSPPPPAPPPPPPPTPPPADTPVDIEINFP